MSKPILQRKTIAALANMIALHPNDQSDLKDFFVYRGSTALTNFFYDCDLNFTHDGSSRTAWTEGCLNQILSTTNHDKNIGNLITILSNLMDISDNTDIDHDRQIALTRLNNELQRDNYQGFYDENKTFHLRELNNQKIIQPSFNPNTALTKEQRQRQRQRITLLTNYLDNCSEDNLIENILLPLFDQLGFRRVRFAGHKDKALEYGKDMWMHYELPTQHRIYFGIQVKKGKIDATGKSSGNVAELYAQCLMMLNNPIYDETISRKVLVDHVYIISGHEITKQARNWLVEALDQSQRRAIIFMDRIEIITLFSKTDLTIPSVE